MRGLDRTEQCRDRRCYRLWIACSRRQYPLAAILVCECRWSAVATLEVARQASGRCHVVFVTAYDQFAVAAFEEARRTT